MQTALPILAHFFRAESSSSQEKVFPELSDLSIFPHIENCFEVQPSTVILPSNRKQGSVFLNAN